MEKPPGLTESLLLCSLGPVDGWGPGDLGQQSWLPGAAPHSGPKREDRWPGVTVISLCLPKVRPIMVIRAQIRGFRLFCSFALSQWASVIPVLPMRKLRLRAIKQLHDPKPQSWEGTEPGLESRPGQLKVPCCGYPSPFRTPWPHPGPGTPGM